MLEHALEVLRLNIGEVKPALVLQVDVGANLEEGHLGPLLDAELQLPLQRQLLVLLVVVDLHQDPVLDQYFT